MMADSRKRCWAGCIYEIRLDPHGELEIKEPLDEAYPPE
jgi:hypothetical protein